MRSPKTRALSSSVFARGGGSKERNLVVDTKMEEKSGMLEIHRQVCALRLENEAAGLENEKPRPAPRANVFRV